MIDTGYFNLHRYTLQELIFRSWEFPSIDFAISTCSGHGLLSNYVDRRTEKPPLIHFATRHSTWQPKTTGRRPVQGIR